MTSFRIIILALALFATGCAIQHLKPKTLNQERMTNDAIVFGTIAFDTSFNRYAGASFELRSVETSETHRFAAQEYQPDHETDEALRQLFLRQIPPGNYEIITFMANSHPNYYTLEPRTPFPITLHEGDVVYLGRIMFTRTWGKNMFRMTIPGFPELTIIEDLDIDHSIAKRYFKNMPPLDTVQRPSWLSHGRITLEDFEPAQRTSPPPVMQ